MSFFGRLLCLYLAGNCDPTGRILCQTAKSNKEISQQTGYNERYITTLMQKYQKQGLEEFIRIKQTSHNRNLTTAEEAEILKTFERYASEGKMLTVAEINQAFEERLGKKLPHNYIYRVLKRQGWRKIMPRSKHP